jgi:putative membrane protein
MPSDGAAPARRLHPLSLLFTIGRLAKNLLLPGLLVVVFAARGGNGELWFMFLFVPAVIAALVEYWSYRYRFDRDELVIREGLLFRNERHIPFARIQNVDLVQNPFHRLLGVVEVRLETAGGEKPEAAMRVLALDAVEQLRRKIFAGREDGVAREASGVSGTAPAAASAPLVSMAVRDVLLFGLITNRGMVVVAAALGALWQFDLFERWWESLSRESLARYRALLPGESLLSTGLLALGAVVLFLLLVRALSLVWATAKFLGFRLTRRGDDLRAEHGVLPHVSKTIPRHRIQVFSVYEGLLHRWCRRVSVQVETAGGSGGEEQGGIADRLWLAPLLDRDRVPDLLREALPDVEVAAWNWQPLSPRAARRLLRLGLYGAVVGAALAVAWLGLPGLAAAPVLALLAWCNARLYVEHTAWALVPGALVFRSGWWGRWLSVARFGKIQSVEHAQSPFDRRHAMGTVRVDTAGATRTGHTLRIPYLDAAVASALAERLYAEAGRTAFRW